MTALRTGPWSDRETRHLRKMERQRRPVSVMAETLGRTLRSVESKLDRMRVPRPPRILGPPLPPEEMTDIQKLIDINDGFLAALAAEHQRARP